MIEIDGKKIFFPIKYIPRDYQIDALDFIKKSILTKKKYILLNLSTGTGKSMLAATLFTNWYKNVINKNAKFDIITNSKVLQEQYLKDFDFIKNYKGKSNYYCQHFDTDCGNGKELSKILKHHCGSCPYDIAKNKWIHGDISLTNFHLFNTLSIYQQNILEQRKSNVLIIDECHDFESVFSDFLSTKLNANILKKCGFTLKEVEKLDNLLSKIKSLTKYLDFLEKKIIPDLEKKHNSFENKIISTSDIKKKRQLSQYIQSIEGKLLSFNGLFETYKKDPNNIVLDIFINKKEKMYSGVDLITQPIWVYDYIYDYVWRHYDHIIFMSASILDKEMFSYINGLDKKLTTYYEIKSPFLIKNRPIYYLKGIGKMNWTSKEETFKKQIVWIKKILKKYKNKKGIIHTTNYEISDWVKENIEDDRLLFHNVDDRQEILEKHLTSKEPTVIVSPSMVSGISLDDELGRFQIILKIPYPNISSNKIKARSKTNNKWYSFKTICDLSQCTGRIVRGPNDYGDTYILDSNFSDILKYNSHILPQHIQNAIKVLKV